MKTSKESSLQVDNDDQKKSRSANIDDTHTTISSPLPNNLLAIFKVRFHVHRGNELVWQHPPDIDLQGVEYQLICSGLHLVEKDTIYFSRENGIGVGVFENRESDHDRGANMQAIGVLTASPSSKTHTAPLDLWQHVRFLANQLGKSLDNDLDPKDEYYQLEDYYNAHRYHRAASQHHYYITPVPLNTRYFQPFESVPYALTYYIESSVFPLSNERLQQQQQWHRQDPSRGFSDMVQALGPSVFTLWKAILLKQRILMMKPTPPMEQLCYFVYNGYLMDQWQSAATSHIQSHMALKFNIGINDINQLENYPTRSGYIACTSDAIFDFKKDLYDVLIKFPTNGTHATVTTSSPITVNAADHVRYKLLMDLFPSDNNMRTTTTPTTTNDNDTPSSYWAYYRYDWITRWEASMAELGRKWSNRGGNVGLDPSLLAQRTQMYPLYQQQLQQQEANSSSSSLSDGSMHMLEDAVFAPSAPLIMPSSQPLTSSQELLLGDQINLNDPSEFPPNPSAAEARALDYNNQPDQVLTWGNAPTMLPDTSNNTLLGFFHVLTSQLISALQTLVDNVDEDEVILGIKDMVQLGLDPWDDRYLVAQLGLIYFNKQISVSVCRDLSSCCGCCCSSRGGHNAPIQL